MLPIQVLPYTTILQLEGRPVPHSYELETMLSKQVKTKLEVIEMNFCVINFNFKMHQYTSKKDVNT